MKNLLSIVLLLSIVSFRSKAATDITTATVSGHWTISGSPYKIFNNIAVSPGQTLTIDPGVEIVFQGFFSVDVPVGTRIVAVGTPSKYINFKIKDTSGWSDKTSITGGWNGMTISGNYYSTAAGDSPIAFCNFSDIKTGRIRIAARNIKINNCNFFHNHTSGSPWGSGLLTIDADTTDQVELYQCHFYNNALDSSCKVLYASGSANTYVHECIFNDNTALSAFSASNNNVLLEKNEFFNNKEEMAMSCTGTVTIWYSNAVVKNNKIHYNTGTECGALSCHNSFADINGNVICNNSSTKGFTSSAACGQSQGAGAVRISSYDSTKNYYCTIRDNVIANNFAAYSGGAIYVWRIATQICNNQIVHNASGDGSGGNLNSPAIHLDNNPITAGRNAVKIKNNLFYDNAGFGSYFNGYSLRVWGGDTIEYTYNWTNNPYHARDVWDGGSAASYTYLGDTATNISGTNPGMIDPTATSGISEDATDNNFALLPASPCINKGDTSGINIDAFDNTNHPRIYGSAIDIGAHEYGPWTTTLGAQPITLANTVGGFSIYPNPATTMFFIATPSATGTLILQNTAGNLIAERAVTNTLTSFDIHTLPRGLYFATWEHNGEREWQKVTVE